MNKPTMRSLILYGSQTKLTNAHKLVTIPTQPPKGRKQPAYYVRADTFAGDMNRALSRARPMPGETVLNTVNIEEPK